MSTTQLPPDGVAPDTATGEEPPLDRTQIYDVLSNERRAMVLELLSESDPRELSTLAEEIAARETGERPPPRKKRTSVYVTLHQTHLPKLATLNIVEYDDREKVVRLDDRAPAVFAERDDAVTATDTERTSEWAGISLALVVTGLGTAGASEIGLPGLSAITPGAYALATLVVLLAVLAFHVGRAGAPLRRRRTTDDD